MIGGFVVTGDAPKKIIVRGLGPSLAVNGTPLANILTDPVLELYQNGSLITSNDNWRDSQRSEIEATGIPPANDLESALVATLAPGSYTVILRGQTAASALGWSKPTISIPPSSPRLPTSAPVASCRRVTMF